MKLLLMIALLMLAGTGWAEMPKRPFLLINAEELEQLRGELSKPGWKADLYRAQSEPGMMPDGIGIRSNADLWLNRKIENPGYGGHYHHFFCVDGNPLQLPADQAFAPGPYRCTNCGRTYEGPLYEAAVRRAVHFWLSNAALDLALVSALENKPEYAAKSAEILAMYAETYPGPHTDHIHGGMIYQSLCESMWVIPLAQAYDLVYNSLSSEQRTRIERFLHTVAGGIQRCGTGGNWGSWHLSAVGVVGYAIGDEELIAWATDRFKQQIRDQLGDDGLWPESVHTYHFFPLMAFVSFAEAAYHAGVDLYRWEGKPGKSLLNMFSAPLEYAYPDLRLPAINDGWFDSWLPPGLYEAAFYRTGDPRYAWVIANGYHKKTNPAGIAGEKKITLRNTQYAFLFGREVPEETPGPPSVSVDYPVLGICMLRSPDNKSMLSFHYGPFRGHGHVSKMSITLHANGKLWAADYGTPGYGSAILPWYKSTHSHNVVVVDGRNQAQTKENKAKLWLGDPLIEAVQSETKEAYPGVTCTRTVVRIDDYYVIQDRLSSDSDHVYDFYFHSEGEFALDNASGKSEPLEPSSKWITGLVAHENTNDISCRWSGATRGLALRIFGTNMTPITGECPAETGSHTIPLLIVRQTGKSAEFVSVLYPYTAKLDLHVKNLGEKLVVIHDGLEDRLTIPSDGSKPVLERKGL